MNKSKTLTQFNPNLGQRWTNPNVGLKTYLKMYSWKWKLKILNYIYLGLSIF